MRGAGLHVSGAIDRKLRYAGLCPPPLETSGTGVWRFLGIRATGGLDLGLLKEDDVGEKESTEGRV